MNGATEGRHALLIGNSRYDDPGLDALGAPQEDVLRLREVLCEPGIGGFEARLALDLGMDEVRTAIVEFLAARRPDDFALVYYTGHGLRDESGDLYLALQQTRVAAPAAVSIEAEFLRRQLDRSQAGTQLLVLDCCHSGAVAGPGAKRAATGPTLTQTDFGDGNGRGRAIMAASAAGESAFEVEGRSIYTHHLIDATETGGAAPDKDVVTVTDLHAYLARRVPDGGWAMQPHLWVSGQTGPIVVARNPSPRKPLPPDLVEKLWDTDLDRAYSAAVQLGRLAQGDEPSLATDAEAVLRQRLETPTTLVMTVGDEIRSALAAVEEERRAEEAPTGPAGGAGSSAKSGATAGAAAKDVAGSAGAGSTTGQATWSHPGRWLGWAGWYLGSVLVAFAALVAYSSVSGAKISMVAGWSIVLVLGPALVLILRPKLSFVFRGLYSVLRGILVTVSLLLIIVILLGLLA